MLNDKVIARDKCQELKKLIGNELNIVATFLQLLMEFSRDKRHEQLGFASMWDFCRKGLGLCESTTGRRLKAIKVIEGFPAAVDYLRDGRLCVTRLLLLADVLTAENATDLFEGASRKSLRDIELLVASEDPKPAPPPRIHKFPTKSDPPTPAPSLNFDAPAEPVQNSTLPSPHPTEPEPEPEAPPAPEPKAEPTPLPRPRRRATVRPTSAQEYSARLPVSREWVQKLELAKKFGSHVVPTGDPVAILELALDLFIEKYGKRRGAIAPKPRAKKAAPEVATAPAKPADAEAQKEPPKKERFTADDRRALWNRDGGRCVWPVDTGGVCGSEWQLEVDHVEAAAKGGATDVSSARQLCRKHNDQHARETFGEAFLEAKKRASKVATRVASSSGGDGRS